MSIMTTFNFIECLAELELGSSITRPIIETYLREKSIQIERRIRNGDFSLKEFMEDLELTSIESIQVQLEEHGYTHPATIATLTREQLKKMNIRVGNRLKLLGGVVILRYLGYECTG